MRRIRPRLSQSGSRQAHTSEPRPAPLTDADGIPRHRDSTPLRLLRSAGLDSQGVKIIRLLTSPRVRFSDAALRRELPELVRCAARGPLGGTVSSEVIRSSYVGDVTHTGEVPEDVLQRRHDRVLVRTGDVVRHPATPLERRDRRILLDHRQTVGLWLTSDWSRAKMPLSSPRVSPCGLRCSANGCWLVS